MDPLTDILRRIARCIADLPDPAAWLILRALLFFGVTSALTGWAFQRGSRSQFVQVMAFTFGLLVATFLPVAWLLPTHPMAKAGILLVALVVLAFLPAQLAFFLTPNAGLQKWLRRISYGFLVLLFFLLP